MENYDDDWVIIGLNNYVEFEADELQFAPSERKNLLGHAAEWRAQLSDRQAQALASIADPDGGDLHVDWGVFICPAYIKNNQLVVNTSGV